MPLSSYGVNLTPPSPISYAAPARPGDISSVIGSVTQAQNQANQANNLRYGQQLGVLNAGANGANLNAQGAITAATQGYNAATANLGSSLSNNNAIWANDKARLDRDAQAASAAAQQSAISRGLGNTTIVDSLNTGVQRTKQEGYANAESNKASLDNGVYQNLANLNAAKGSNLANLYNSAGQTYAQGAGAIGNAIAGRNDVGPSLADYASLIQGASAAQNSGGRSVISTTIPDTSALGQRINNPGATAGISGGISSSMGGGGFNSGGPSSIPRSGGGGGGGGGGAISSAVGGGSGGGVSNDSYTPPEMHNVNGPAGGGKGESFGPAGSDTPQAGQSPIPQGSTPVYGTTGADMNKIIAWKTPSGTFIKV
jgi:hypothetical protein